MFPTNYKRIVTHNIATHIIHVPNYSFYCWKIWPFHFCKLGGLTGRNYGGSAPSPHPASQVMMKKSKGRLNLLFPFFLVQNSSQEGRLDLIFLTFWCIFNYGRGVAFSAEGFLLWIYMLFPRKKTIKSLSVVQTHFTIHSYSLTLWFL